MRLVMKVVRLRKFTIIEKLFFKGLVSDLLSSLKIKSYLKRIYLGFKKRRLASLERLVKQA